MHTPVKAHWFVHSNGWQLTVLSYNKVDLKKRFRSLLKGGSTHQILGNLSTGIIRATTDWDLIKYVIKTKIHNDTKKKKAHENLIRFF